MRFPRTEEKVTEKLMAVICMINHVAFEMYSKDLFKSKRKRRQKGEFISTVSKASVTCAEVYFFTGLGKFRAINRFFFKK